MPAGSKAAFSRAWIAISGADCGVNTPSDLSPWRNSVACPPAAWAIARTWAAGTGCAGIHQRWPPPHSINCVPPAAEGRASGAAVVGTARRHSGAPAWDGAKNGCVCSRSACHSACASPCSIASPPRRSRAARNAAAAPDSRTCSTPSCQTDAAIGSGWPPHWFRRSSASASFSSKRSVASSNGTGSTFSETSRISPRVPSEPAISRDTS